MKIILDRIQAEIYDKEKKEVVYKSKFYEDYLSAYDDGKKYLNQYCDCYCELQINVVPCTINGMEYSRYIASQLLTDSNLEGDKYYEKEDEIKQIIDDCFLEINDNYTEELRRGK